MWGPTAETECPEIYSAPTWTAEDIVIKDDDGEETSRQFQEDLPNLTAAVSEYFKSFWGFESIIDQVATMARWCDLDTYSFESSSSCGSLCTYESDQDEGSHEIEFKRDDSESDEETIRLELIDPDLIFSEQRHHNSLFMDDGESEEGDGHSSSATTFLLGETLFDEEEVVTGGYQDDSTISSSEKSIPQDPKQVSWNTIYLAFQAPCVSTTSVPEEINVQDIPLEKLKEQQISLQKRTDTTASETTYDSKMSSLNQPTVTNLIEELKGVQVAPLTSSEEVNFISSY